MLSLERIRELLGAPDLSDREAAEIRDYLRALAELAFEQWRQHRARCHEGEAGDATRQPQNYGTIKEGQPTGRRPSLPL